METDSLLAKSRRTQNTASPNQTKANPLRRDRSSEKLTHNGYKSLANGTDEEAVPLTGFVVGQLYRYKPNDKCPRVSVFRLPQTREETHFLGNINRSQVFMCLERVDQRWVKISSSQMDGYIALPPSFQIDREIFQPISSYKAYEDFGSRHIFFWEGRQLVGPDTGYFLFSLIAIPTSLVLYIVLVTNRFPAIVGALLALTSLLLVAFSVLNLLITGLMDPGIIPRKPPHHQSVPTPTEAEALTTHGWKYCSTCNIYRPPRAKHCRICDCCVDKFDHHCPFVSTCIGRRNERFFVRFLFSLTAYMVLVTLSSLALLVVAIVHDDEKRAILRVAEAVLAHPMALTLVFLGCSIMPVFLRFSAYHWHLRCIDRTTNEVETGKQQQRSSSSPSSSSSPIPSYQATPAPAAPAASAALAAPGGMQQARPIEDLPVLQRHHSFAQHGLGGYMNWHDVCCGEVVPSRLGDGTRYRSTHDFLVAHVDPKQYPALFELHMASSNLLLTAQATEQTREGIAASVAAAAAATDMVTLVDEDDLQYSPSISSNSKRSWSERASPFGSQHNSFVVARGGGVQPAANGTSGTALHGHSLEGDYDPSRLYPVRSFYISTDDSSV